VLVLVHCDVSTAICVCILVVCVFAERVRTVIASYGLLTNNSCLLEEVILYSSCNIHYYLRVPAC